MKTDKELFLMGINQEIADIEYKLKDAVFEMSVEKSTDLSTLKQLIEALEHLYVKRKFIQED